MRASRLRAGPGTREPEFPFSGGISDPALHWTLTGPTVLLPAPPPVDTAPPPAHGPGVSKKPHKIEEPKAAYPAKKPAKATAAQPGEIRYATPEQARKAAAEVFEVHKELFRKLAQ